MKEKSLLVVVVGPTAVGKTTTAIALAQRFSSQIISSDSRQFYREMEIGTAKPDAKELVQVTHRFVNSHTIEEEYDAGSFARDVHELLPSLFKDNPIQVMVGGSGLYVTAVCDGLDDMPTIEEGVRDSLKRQFEKEGLVNLLLELEQYDSDYFNKIDHSNTQRVIRALEVIRQSGKSYSSFRKNHTSLHNNFEIVKIGLEMDRQHLYDRINRRMDLMIEQGLFEEAKALHPFKDKNALQTVGYKEIFDYLEGSYDREEAIRLLKRNSRRYAKRQLTWFKKDESITWFRPDQLEEMVQLIKKR